jgi:hypothetical protein
MTNQCMIVDWASATEHCKNYRVREMLYEYLLKHVSNNTIYDPTPKPIVEQSQQQTVLECLGYSIMTVCLLMLLLRSMILSR